MVSEKEAGRALDRHSALPLYHQLKAVLKEDIENGLYGPGDLLPSEPQLAAIYKVSRITAKQAVVDLVREGLLYRIQGKGTFVAQPVVEQELRGMFSFSEDARKKGMNPTDQLLVFTIRRATRKLALRLAIQEESQVIEIQRLRFVNDVPLAIQEAFLPHDIFPGLSRQDLLASGSLYRLLGDKYGRRPAGGRETYSVGIADARESDLLQVERGSAVFRIERESFDAKGMPIENVRSTIRGDLYRVQVELGAAKAEYLSTSL